MTPEMVALLIGIPVGLVTTATSGLASLGIRRLLKSHDEMRQEQTEQGKQIAGMQSKLPNGEWRAITEGMAACTAGVTAVSVDVAALRGELGKHILEETTAFAETRAIVSTCKRMLDVKPKRRVRR